MTHSDRAALVERVAIEIIADLRGWTMTHAEWELMLEIPKSARAQDLSVAIKAAERTVSAMERTRDAAVAECKAQQITFLSPEYATGQPLSSFSERFACGQCATAIFEMPLTLGMR
jgi:hypothetical protein